MRPPPSGPDVRPSAADPQPSDRSSLAERQQSATAYADLSRNDAAVLAGATFPDYLDALDDSPLANPADEILRYTGAHTMIVDPAGSEDPELAISSTPLQIGNASGNLRPLDTDVEPTLAGYESQRAGIDASFPSDLTDGVELADQDVVFGFAGSGEASAPKPIEGSAALFYSDVATDTDLIVSPVYAGFSFALQLRSARSPERIVLPLELPRGAELRTGPDPSFARSELPGSALIELPGSGLLTISPPIAVDADGRPIETHLEVQDEDLVIVVRHSEGAPRLPILVDPTVVDSQIVSDDYFEGNPYDYATHGWSYFEGPAAGPRNPYYPYQGKWDEFFGPGTNSGGFFSIAPLGTGYGANIIGRWLLSVPNYSSGTTAYYNRAKFISPWLYVAGGPSPAGLAPMLEYGLVRPQSGYPWWARKTYYGTRNTLVGPPGGETWMGPTNDGWVKQIAFGLNSAGGRAMAPDETRTAYLGGMRTYIADGEAPTVTGGSQAAVPGPNTWIKDDVQTSASFSARDGGLGIKQLRLKGGHSVPQAVDLVTREARTGGPSSPLCEGWSPANACQQDYSAEQLPAGEKLTFNISQLPEGRNDIYAQAFDALTKYSAPTDIGEIKVDRSPPVMGEPAGSLYAQRDGIDDNEDYRLTVTADDGAPGNPATLRSGVKRIDVFLDDDPEASFSAHGSCAGTECPSHLEETFEIEPAEFDEGTHMVHIRAIDGAGNPTTDLSRDFEVEVLMDDSLPAVTLTPSEPASDGSFTVEAAASDGASRANADPDRPYGSGVAELEPYVDGEPYGEPYRAPADCPQGGCDLTHTFTFGPEASLAEHEVRMQVVDFSDNSDYARIGQPRQAYDYFGYNDAYNACCNDPVPENTPVTERDKQHRHLLETSQIGGANVARFGISIDLDFDLEGQLRPIFESIKYLNRNGVRMHALPVIVGPVPLASITGDNQENNNLQRYRSLVNYIADNFGDDPAYGLIGIEAFNEPNLEPFWGHHAANGDWLPPAPDELAEAVNAAYQGVANAAPALDIPVILPSMSPFRFGLDSSHDKPFQVLPVDDNPTEKNHTIDAIALTDAYLLRLDRDYGVPASAIRANSLHLYANATPTFRDKMRNGQTVRPGIETLFFAYMNRMRQRVSAHGYPSEEWITEVGFPSIRTDEQRMSTERCRGNKARELTARTAPSKCRKTFRPTIARQYSRLTRTFMRFQARNSLKMFLVHRFYNDLIPFDDEPGDDDPKNGKDGTDEGNFGVWPRYDVGKPKRARDDGERGVLYCALNDLQSNRLAPYSEIPPSFQCRRGEVG